MPTPYPTELERQLRRAYVSQRQSATKRGIAFLFTLDQWFAWWLTDDRWSRRGRKAGQFQMGRKDNRGPYSPDNVVCVTKVAKKGGLARSGEKHWRATPVVTPLGTFATIAAAAKAHGFDRSYGSYLAKRKRKGWRFLHDPT